MWDLSELDDQGVRDGLRQLARELLRREHNDQQPLVWYLPTVGSGQVVKLARRPGGELDLFDGFDVLARLHPADTAALIAWLVVNDPGAR